MAPSYWPSAQAADWQRPAQPNQFSHAFHAPDNGLLQYNVHGPNTLVGPAQAFQPGFAGFAVRGPPPPAPRDHSSVNKSGFQPGAAQARTAWNHHSLNHLQHVHPTLGQHFHQQQTFVRQPSNHRNGQQPKRGFRSRTVLYNSAKPLFPGSPRGSSASSSTADVGEASDVSSVSTLTSSSQTSIAGERFCPLICLNKH